jgi:hypothetical protein
MTPADVLAISTMWSSFFSNVAAFNGDTGNASCVWVMSQQRKPRNAHTVLDPAPESC